jgi:hypothetical protein
MMANARDWRTAPRKRSPIKATTKQDRRDIDPFVFFIVFLSLAHPDVHELVALLADAPVETGSSSPGAGPVLNAVRPSRVRSMLASRACRSLIMIGDPLDKQQMVKVRTRAGLRYKSGLTNICLLLNHEVRWLDEYAWGLGAGRQP